MKIGATPFPLAALALIAIAAPATSAPSTRPAAAHDIAADALWSPPSSLGVLGDRPETATPAFRAEWQLLVATDAKWEPDPTVQHVPSSCLEVGDHACIACFTKAYKDLDFAHATLERLRAIYGATKTMSDQAVATGDTIAPALGGGEDEWQRQRAGILQTIDHLKGTYRAKYTDLTKTVAAAALAIDRCERLVYGEAEWYERYGKPLATFLETRYRLPD